ncbi:MAG: NADH-ubiquinone oxidoreductase chain [Myxococcaceae bacterium]|nr:NADH-ubiquinone oxidoreductase chain [Myxococcaceae bacterium]
MPSFKLDGKEIAFEPGDTIIRAAWRQGIEIPHYCWHPGLTIAANCRMCLVEIKSERPMVMPIVAWDEAQQAYVPAGKPKLQPACQMPAVDGQEVFAQSSEVKRAQASVQEFLLLNHPVDCPICDQAGECKLQDYYDAHQATHKRKRTEPVHKVKAERFGDTIVYDGERCVMCTRCIRFNDEVVGDHVLDMRERGNKNEITLSPGRELDHKYTLMNEHVCPVGALTSSDFRFKARVWFLKSQTSICSGCATGCNMFIDFDPRNNTVYRLRPRDNPAQNQYWMCDDGMMTYKAFHEGRVINGRVREGRGAVIEVDVSEAIDAAAKLLRSAKTDKLAVVLSAHGSNEDNLALATLAKQLGTDKLYLAALGGWEGDKIIRNADNNPNRAGAQLVAGGGLKPLGELLADIASGAVESVVALGFHTAESAQELAPLAGLATVISLTSNEGVLPSLANVVIPIATHAETFGTFVNAKGVAQQFKRAIFPPEGVRSGWETIDALSLALGQKANFGSLKAVRAALPQVPAQEAQV